MSCDFSFSINTEYIAKIKFLFNKASIYPTEDDKKIISDALSMTTLLLEKNIPPLIKGQSEELVYYANNFLAPQSDYYSTENIQYLHSVLVALKKDVKLWLKQNAEKHRNKNESINTEIKLMDQEENNLREKIRRYISIDSDSIAPEDDRYFSQVGKSFRYTYDTWLYRIALDDEIAEFYLLHNMRASGIKANFIIQCIENKNYNRAIELIDLIIKTSAYEDYSPKYSNKWELTALNIIREVLYEYSPRNSKFKNDYTEEKRIFVVELAEQLMPYLTVDSQKCVLGHLSLVDPEHRYEQRYITTLVDDVEHYAQIKRPRGWGSARVINRISSEIISCFSILEELGRIDVMVKVLSKLKSAGSALTPINYSRWLNEFCKENVSSETFKCVKNELLQQKLLNT